MGVRAAVFESAGKRTDHWIPGVYSRSYNISSPSSVSTGNLCIMGKSTGGEPCKLMEFGSIADAKDVLVSGELLDGIAYAFNGSNDYIPQRVYAMRVNGGVRSKMILKTNSTELMRLTAWDYGNHTNQLKIKIENGSSEKSKKVTTVYKDSSQVVDNIVHPSLKILSGEDEAKIVIDANSLTLSFKEEEETKTETLSFDDFETVGDLVARINDTDSFSAVLVDMDTEFATKNLDTLTSDIPMEGIILYANFYAFTKVMEANEFLSKVEILSSTTRTVPENIPFTYFTDGSGSNYTNEDWENALRELETKDIQIITTPSTENDIQTLILNHCISMNSTVNRKERTCIFGGALEESDDVAIQKAKNFNSKLCSYVVDTVKTANPITGQTEYVSGAILACMLAGMESAMAVHIPLTNKTIKVLDFKKHRTITNIENLIKNGIVCCNPNPDEITNYVVIRAVTTYQQDDLIANERSMVREDLYMNRDLRKTFAPITGNPNNISLSTIIQTLQDKGEDWADAGYLIRNNGNQSVWNISAKKDGDKIYLTYSRYLTAPVNFLFITVANYVYTSTVAL